MEQALGLSLLGLTMALLGFAVQAEDWPTYMHDNSRSGITSEELKLPLSLHWRISPQTPHRPAWPGPQEGSGERQKMVFDDSFATVVAGDTVYFGSSVDFSVYAVNAATGRIRWRFATGGAVRLAPTVDSGKVYFGSDDGYAYGLDARDGSLIWQVRCGPSPRRLLGHGRLVSPWPVRTGVLVSNGRAFFGGGVFMMDGMHLHAVDAATGTRIWHNSNPVKSAYTAQGYWLLAEDHLISPSGRSTPFFFSARTGEISYRRGYRGKGVGGPGTYAVIADGELISGTQLKLSYYDMATGMPGRAIAPALKICSTSELMYVLAPDSVRALKFSYFDALKEAEKLPRNTSGLRARVRRRMSEIVDENSVWKVAGVGFESMIMAGPTILVGGKGKVMAVGQATGRTLWQTTVDGTVKSLTVANGSLLASTDKGDILCFRGGDAPEEDAATNVETRTNEGDHALRNTAARILEVTGTDRGYCLLLGERSSSLAATLAGQPGLRIYCHIEDTEKAAKKRRELLRDGL